MTSLLTGTSDAVRSTSVARMLAAVAVGGAAVLVLGSDDGVVLCPYRRCTGGDCPLCGVTRASGRLVRGDVAGSVAMHPMVVLWAIQIPLWMAVSLRADRTGSNPYPWWQRHGPTVLLANIAVATAVWAVRLIAGDVTPPTELTLPW